MPNKTLIAMAKKAGISTNKAEEYWSRAKEIYKKRIHNIPEDLWTDRDWAYVMGIVKEMIKTTKTPVHTEEAKIRESLRAQESTILSFEEFLAAKNK